MKDPQQAPVLTREDVIGVTGPLDDDKITAIIATRASLEELVEAYAWACDETDALADAEKSLSGAVAEVYDILTAEDVWTGPER